MGLSFNSVYRTLLGQGMSYRRIEMLRRWNELKGWAATVADIELMYIDKPIPDVRHLYPEGNIGEAWRYRTMTTLQHKTTGEIIEEPFTILTDHQLSLDEINEAVLDFIKKYPYLEDYDILETHLTEAMKRR